MSADPWGPWHTNAIPRARRPWFVCRIRTTGAEGHRPGGDRLGLYATEAEAQAIADTLNTTDPTTEGN